MSKKQTIYEQLNLFNYKDYDSIPLSKKAWITIHAKQQGYNPDEVHAQIKRKMGGSKKVFTPIESRFELMIFD